MATKKGNDVQKTEDNATWQPIETAPNDELVVVGWLDAEDHEHPERHDFDVKEDDVWVKHEDLYQEFCCVAPPGSRGPKQTAPYTHWMKVPPIPAHTKCSCGEMHNAGATNWTCAKHGQVVTD